MAGKETELSIRSQHGLLRDLLPIYSLPQLILNLVVLGPFLWLGLWLGRLPPFLILVLLLGWVLQFVSRPCVMIVSPVQAAWLEAVLDAQGFFGRSDSDGRWRQLDRQWWQRWPHEFIAFSPGEAVRLFAPRDVMEGLRNTLEALEEQGALSAAPDLPLDYRPDEGEPERLPWPVHVPAAVLGGACVIAWFWQVAVSGFEGMGGWGISGRALAQGRFETIFLHMFAHGGVMHLVMNMTALSAVGGALVSRLGPPPASWLRFLLLYLLSGLAGAACYLALHPTGSVPMLGASGALYGILGLLIRYPATPGEVTPADSTRVRRVGLDLIKENAFLFVLLGLMSWASGSAGGLAWEAHLGGFLFGLFVGPKLLPRPGTLAQHEKASEALMPQA